MPSATRWSAPPMRRRGGAAIARSATRKVTTTRVKTSVPRRRKRGHVTPGSSSHSKSRARPVREDPHLRAARLILAADFHLFVAGAGMSADSGLPVYASVAKMPQYSRRGLDYGDLCDPEMLKRDQETFFGFWGQCFNSYRDIAPHVGYQMLLHWVQHAARVGRDTKDALLRGADININDSGLDIEAAPQKPFYVYTSNVDGHFVKAGFPKDSVFEIHGGTEQWQCSVPCCDTLFPLPKMFRFLIDSRTLRCPAPSPRSLLRHRISPSDQVVCSRPMTVPSLGSNTELRQTKSLPAIRQQPQDGSLTRANSASERRIGTETARFIRQIGLGFGHREDSPSDAHRVLPMHQFQKTDHRSNQSIFRKFSQLSIRRPSLDQEIPVLNRPHCARCGCVARPHVLMFDDDHWVWPDAEEAAYLEWIRRVRASRGSLCVIEVGCGKRVPTCRMNSHKTLKKVSCSGLIRINPVESGVLKTLKSRTISIKSGGLDALRKINAHIHTLLCDHDIPLTDFI